MKTLRLALSGCPETPRVASLLGVTGVPVDGSSLLSEGIEVTMQPLRCHGLEACQIEAFFFNPLHPDDKVRNEASEKIRHLIPIAAEVGCGFVAFGGGSLNPDIFGGSDPGNLTEEALSEAAQVLAPLAQIAETHNIILSLEPHIRSVLNTPERASDLISRVGSPSLKTTFDITNYYDFMDLLSPSGMLERCSISLGSSTGLVHLKECLIQPGFHIHAGLGPMGAGQTDWSAVIAEAFRLAPDRGWVVVEHCETEAEARASVSLVRAAASALQLSLK